MDHVFFSTYYMLLSKLHSRPDPINTNICYSAMSTSCVASTVLSPQAFLVSFMETQYSRHMQSHSLTKWLTVHEQFSLSRLHFFCLCTTSHSSICFLPQSSNSTVFRVVFPCRILAGEIGLTSQSVSLFKGFTLILSFNFNLSHIHFIFLVYQLKVLICI